MSKKQADSSKSGAKLQIKKAKSKDKTDQKQLKIVAEQKSAKKTDKKQKQENQEKKEKNEEKEEKKQKKKKKDKKKKNKDTKLQDDEAEEQNLKKSQSKQNQKDNSKSKDKKGKKDKTKKNKDKGQKNQQSVAQVKKQNIKSKKSISVLSASQDNQLNTIKNIHKSESNAKVTIQQLIKQYKSAAEAMLFNNHGHDPQKEKLIQKRLESLQKQKEKRHKKMQQLDKHKQEIESIKEKQKETNKQLRYQKLREKKIKKIQQKLSNLQISAEQRRKQYQKFKEYVRQRQKIKPCFKRYEQQFQESLQQEQQSYRQKLQQLIKKYQPMNKNELDHFQQNYTLQKEQTDHYRANKLKLEQDLIQEENQRWRSKLWKGQCHKNVREELQLLQERKKKPKQRLEAMKEYCKIVNQSLGKQQNQQTQQVAQIEDKQQINQNVVYHQKYVKGVNYGLVPVQITTPMSLEQKYKLGRIYLQQAKQLRNDSKTVDHGNSKKLDDSRQLRNKSQTFKIKRVSNPYYASPINRKSLDFNNYESIEYSLQKIGSISKDKKLHDQIIRHGEYGSILQIQQKKRKVGSLLVKQINDKLDLLNKL